MPGTPPPGSSPYGAPGTPAPSGPFPVPGTPPPPSVPGTPAPFSLDKGDGAGTAATTAIPAGQWSSPGTPPGYGGGYGTPPPGYPPGGYPPGGPVPGRKRSGAGGGRVAVGVIALLLGAAVVAVVALGGDDDPERAGDDTATTTESVPSSPSISAELPDSTTVPDPTTTEGPTTTDPVPTPSLPGTGVSAPPADFPDPPGADESITGGIEVPGMDAQQVADFYEAELPGAGYTVDRVDEFSGVFAITVTGPDQGVLSITAFAPLPTTVLWTPT